MSDELNYIKCKRCSKLVYYTPANTVIYYYKDYPWYSLAYTMCDKCGYKQAYFIMDNLDWELRWAIKHDLGFLTFDGLPEDNIIESFDKHYPNYPHYHQLNQSEETEVKFFEYLLNNTDPREWFDETGESDS